MAVSWCAVGTTEDSRGRVERGRPVYLECPTHGRKERFPKRVARSSRAGGAIVITTCTVAAAATALAGSILVGTLIGVTVANAVYYAYPMVEEIGRRRAASMYEATRWSAKISAVAVPVITLVVWLWLRRDRSTRLGRDRV
jgi:hypothetical protein